MLPDRERTIDILRGLAIFTMVGANMAASVAAQPHPFGLRLYGSYAAPLFILLSGMMVASTAQTKGHGWKYFLLRGAMIMMVGVFVDVVIWNGVCPFVDVDVLYLIGLSVPLAFLYLRLGKSSQWVVIVLIFLLTPFLQKILGYTEYVNPIYLWGEQIKAVPVKTQTNIFNHWIVDGWFPIFPWLGFSLLGVKFAHQRWKYQTFDTFGKKSILLLGLGILTIGIMIWWLYPGSLLTREEASELFYPPTVGYIITTIGLILTLFYIVDRKPSLFIYNPLRSMGESSLFMYVLHIPLIEYVISPTWSEQSVQIFMLIYIGFLFFLILLAYGLRVLKSTWRDRPFIIRFLVGG
jgi:uncharacterized membrane protein